MRAPLFRALNPATSRSTRATAPAHQAGPSSWWANGCSPRRGDKRRPGVSGSDMRRAMAPRLQTLRPRVQTLGANPRGWLQTSAASTTARGYGAAWQRARKLALERDCGLCQVCARAGRVTVATAVDHILPKSRGGTDELGNLQAICTPCHRAKTQTESRGP